MQSIFNAIVASIVAAAIMIYLSIATPLGPWIGPTLLLVMGSFYKKVPEKILLPIAAASTAGIAATATGFSLPTLFFLNRNFFSFFIGNPYYGTSFVFFAIVCIGFFGLVWAWAYKEYFLTCSELSFPIGHLLYSMIDKGDWFIKRIYFGYGALVSFCYYIVFWLLRTTQILQTDECTFLPLLKWGSCSFPSISISFLTFPLLCALGLSAGEMVAMPLIVGIILQGCGISIIHGLFFNALMRHDFLFAFACGLVAITALSGFFSFCIDFLFAMRTFTFSMVSIIFYDNKKLWVIALSLFCSFLFYIKLPWYVILYLVCAVCASTYGIVLIAGKIGLALLGRFATFVMIPALIFFSLHDLHITIIAFAVELVGGIAADGLFSYKAVQLSQKDYYKSIFSYQVIGLIVGACVIAFLFWYLSLYKGLGTGFLFAQRGQARALLINATQWDIKVFSLGVVIGIILKYYKIHPFFVLSGLLMPFSLSIPLSVGSLLSLVLKKRYFFYETFACGIYVVSTALLLLSLI